METLPLEIVYHISIFLPLASIACLALTCHRMKEIMGTRHWLDLEKQSEERHLFLACLEKDTPGYFHCHFCKKLHRPHYPPLHPVNEFTESNCTLTNGRLNVATGYHILFEHVQLAMKRHRLGEDHGMSLDAFSYRGPVSTLRHKSEWLEIEARIVDDELLIYRRYAATLKSWADLKRYTGNLRICSHLGRNEGIYYSGRDRICRENLSLLKRACCRLKYARIAHCTSCIELSRCFSCQTEWSIEQHGRRVILNIWKNLGSGESPSDPRWRYHVVFTNNEPTVMSSPTREAGSIKSAWEMARS